MEGGLLRAQAPGRGHPADDVAVAIADVDGHVVVDGLRHLGHVAGALGDESAAGLIRRSLAESARDTLEWWYGQPELRRERARGWPSADREAALIERLRG